VFVVSSRDCPIPPNSSRARGPVVQSSTRDCLQILHASPCVESIPAKSADRGTAAVTAAERVSGDRFACAQRQSL